MKNSKPELALFKKLLKFVGVLLAFASPAFAQGYHYRDTVTVNAGGQVQVLGNATITVCQPGATGIPCSPTQNIYSNLALSTPITNLHSDVNGNFDFYIAPGNDYVYTAVSSNGSISASFVFTAPCIITGTSCGTGNAPGGSANQLQYNVAGSSFGGVIGSAVTPSTGALLFTAGADTTTPFTVAAHSSTQSATLLEGNSNVVGGALGFPFELRGSGVNSPSWSAGGGHALAYIAPKDDTSIGLMVSNESHAGSNGVHPAVGIYVDANGVPNIVGGNSSGDGSGNYSAIEFHANASNVGESSTPAALAVFVNTSGNGTVPLTIFQPIGGAGPAAADTFDVFRGTALGFPLIGFDSGGAPGSPATNINLFFKGSTSGTAKIGAAAVAGTPCIFALPTSSASAGQFLQAAAPSGGACQTSWVSASQLICSGQIPLSTGAINSGTRATNTLACSGLSTSTDSITCTFSGDTNAVTGYAPSATGAKLDIKTWISSNTINVDQVNNTGSSITPGAATMNCKGLR